MKRKIFTFLKIALSLSIMIYLLLVFVPRSYDVPHRSEKPGTRYWNLKSGSRIAYYFIPSKGLKKKYPLIFLQGGPGGAITDRSIAMMSDFAANGYDVYLYDQTGCGHSSRLDNVRAYTTGRHTRDLEEITGMIHAEKIILIGQSWGAMLATLYAADHQDQIDRLILTGPGPLLPVNETVSNEPLPDSIRGRQAMYFNRMANELHQNIRTNAMSFFARRFGIKIADDNEADDFQTSLNNDLNKATVCDSSHSLRAEAGGGYYAQVMTLNSFGDAQDARPKLQGSKIPLLIMRGECDNQSWGFVKEYLGLFPVHQLVVVPDAGHSVSTEQPEVYHLVINQFLEKKFSDQ